MQYISTRGEKESRGFQDAVMTGLARDGGLLLPDVIPDVTGKLKDWKSLSYTDLAFEVMRLYTDIPERELRDLITRSYASFRHPDVTPVRSVGDIHILELFHGPTLAFKDVALQFLGNAFEYVLKKTGREMNILAATSGDTGSAAIDGVKGREHINIFVMHPHGRVSPLQERQMTTVPDANVFNIAVEGTFDDCQRIMKTIFSDLEFKDRYSLGTVNSINWARVLAQIVYFFFAAFRVMRLTGAKTVQFSIPTGNFGDIFAGYMAARMGLPISRLVLATNENDILSRFFNTGRYSSDAVHATISPSMDIQVASNFERYLYYRLGADPVVLSRVMKQFEVDQKITVPPLANGKIDNLICAGSGNTAQTLATIREFQTRYGYLLDPHTAVGVHVARPYVNPASPMICLATAHPAKFSQAIQEATGSDLAHHPILEALRHLPTRCAILPASEGEIRKHMEKNICT
ncbi:MAG: threonine synthase [bacterium]